MKTNKKLLLMIFTLIIAFSGCKKYEEGPTISLSPKKWRVVNTWKIDKVLFNGQDITSTYIALLPNFSLELKNDNSYVMSYTGGSSAEVGTWDFDSKKENLLMTPNGNSTSSKSEIIRLAGNEMWLRDIDGSDTSEMHYVSQ